MVNYNPQMQQKQYSDPYREQADIVIQPDRGNLWADVLEGAGQLADIYDSYAKQDAKKAKDLDEERIKSSYNEFGRRALKLQALAEQTGNWQQYDTGMRQLYDDFSRVQGLEMDKLIQLGGKTDITKSYSREQDTRKFWNDKENEQAFEAWKALSDANPSLKSTYTPETGMSLINAVNDSWDKSTQYLSALNSINKETNQAEYNRVLNQMQADLGNNVVAASMVAIMSNKDFLDTPSAIEDFRMNTVQKMVSAGVPRDMATIAVSEGLRRSGVYDVSNAVVKNQTMYKEDIERMTQAKAAEGKFYMGVTTDPYTALYVGTDRFKSGEIFNERVRQADIALNKRYGELAFSGNLQNNGQWIPDGARGETYAGVAKINQSRAGTPVLHGAMVRDVFNDARATYAEMPAEKRAQAYKEVLDKFDNVYTDQSIKALKSSPLPEHRMVGEQLEKEKELMQNAAEMSEFLAMPSKASQDFTNLMQGPGANLLRVDDNGNLVVIDGSNGFLQSTAISLTDATGRYFGTVKDFNEQFAGTIEDPEKRKQLLESANIPALQPAREKVIGRKEWYFGGEKTPEYKALTGMFKSNKISDAEMQEIDAELAKSTDPDIAALQDELEKDLKPNVRKAVEGTIKAVGKLHQSEQLANARIITDPYAEGMTEQMIEEHNRKQDDKEREIFLGKIAADAAREAEPDSEEFKEWMQILQRVNKKLEKYGVDPIDPYGEN